MTDRRGAANLRFEQRPSGREEDLFQSQPGAHDGPPGADAYDRYGRRAGPPSRTSYLMDPVLDEGTAAENAGNRLFVMLLFWWMLAASVAVWWFDTPYGSLRDTASVLTATGRVTGMIGGYLLIVQVLMMSRVAWLEAWIGAHSLLRGHRQLGAYVLVMVLAHVVFTVAGYARSDQTSVVRETWTMLTTFEDMIKAFIATGTLVAITFLALQSIRARLRYEVWYVLHLSGYLVLLLGYGHQFSDGADLSNAGFAQWYWIGLYALALSCLLWGRVVEPVWLNLRHRLRVVVVVPESAGMFSVYIGGRRLEDMEVRAGQYFRWRFLTREGWWQSHPFSLSAAPNQKCLRLTISAIGDHTSALRHLSPGTRVIAEGPSGMFTADHQVRSGALLIAGGSGIAPIRALMEEIPYGTVVIYRASKVDDLVFREEMDALAEQRGLHVVYAIGSRRDPAIRRLFTAAGMRELVPDVAHRDVYLCGPPGLISAALRTLRRLGVSRRQVHLDPFEF